MKVGDLKVTPNRVVTDNRQLGIQNYDTGNDYPQRVMQIAKGSGTIGSCLRIYNRFVLGKGFGAMDAFKAGRDTLGAVLRKCVGDYTVFGAFALRVGRFRPVEGGGCRGLRGAGRTCQQAEDRKESFHGTKVCSCGSGCCGMKSWFRLLHGVPRSGRPGAAAGVRVSRAPSRVRCRAIP